MIAGTVTDDGVPVIMLRVADQVRSGIIDTGFNGDLERPYLLHPALHPRFRCVGEKLLYHARCIWG